MGARVNLLTGFVDAFCKGADLISAMIIINWACYAVESSEHLDRRYSDIVQRCERREL